MNMIFLRYGASLRSKLYFKEKMNSIFPIQTASLSKYISKSRTKRLPLTTKRAGKGYYKGNRSRKEGFITSKGRFIIQKERLTELVVPDFTGTKVSTFNLK